MDLALRLDFKGVFAPLADPAYVARVTVDPDLGTICWPNDADVDLVCRRRARSQSASDVTPLSDDRMARELGPRAASGSEFRLQAETTVGRCQPGTYRASARRDSTGFRISESKWNAGAA